MGAYRNPSAIRIALTRHVRFPVKNFVSSQTLTTIWQTLKAAPRSGLSTERRLHDLAQKSWLTAHEVEDLIEAMDHRIGVPDFDLITLSELAGVPMRALTQRPRSRFDDPLGIRAVSAVDTCTILIMLDDLRYLRNFIAHRSGRSATSLRSGGAVAKADRIVPSAICFDYQQGGLRRYKGWITFMKGVANQLVA